jgi:hypothetical protein
MPSYSNPAPVLGDIANECVPFDTLNTKVWASTDALTFLIPFYAVSSTTFHVLVLTSLACNVFLCLCIPICVNE